MMVLQTGRVIEFGAPAKLLEDAEGTFTSMVNEAREQTK